MCKGGEEANVKFHIFKSAKQNRLDAFLILLKWVRLMEVDWIGINTLQRKYLKKV